MAAAATFTAPNGMDGAAALKEEIARLAPTVGDLTLLGQVFRAQILERTARGVDVNGAPFAPYSTKGPYYFYPNAGAAGSVRGSLAPSDKGMLGEVQHARRTAAGNRFKSTGRLGVRTPFGIRYASYAAAQSAHGRSNVTLFGMEQHTHMLNTILVKVDGVDVPSISGLSDLSSDQNIVAHEQATPARRLTFGFYGPEAERAKGNNEGIPGRLPQRQFFALSQDDLMRGAEILGQRAKERAKSKHGG